MRPRRRVEFESSPFRTKWVAAEGLHEVGPEGAHGEDQCCRVCKDGAEMTTDCDAVEMHCYGWAKNLISCVPEKEHLPTMSFTLAGSASLIFFPVLEVLSLMAQDEPQVKLANAVQRLLALTPEKLPGLLTKVKDARAGNFPTSGAGDLIYTPPGWVAVVTGNANVIGFKVRCIISKLTNQMKALNEKLLAHDSASPIWQACCSPRRLRRSCYGLFCGCQLRTAKQKGAFSAGLWGMILLTRLIFTSWMCERENGVAARISMCNPTCILLV